MARRLLRFGGVPASEESATAHTSAHTSEHAHTRRSQGCWDKRGASVRACWSDTIEEDLAPTIEKRS